MAYEFSNSLSTYVVHQYPHADLSRIFTLDAIDRGHTEHYNPKAQTFTTMEDQATSRVLKRDQDDSSLDFLNTEDLQLPESDDDDEDHSPPLTEVNKRLWGLSGDADTASTMTNDALSVKFDDEQTIPSKASESSVRTNKSNISQSSYNTRLQKTEKAQQQTTHDISQIKNNFDILMKHFNNGATKTTASDQKDQAAVKD